MQDVKNLGIAYANEVNQAFDQLFTEVLDKQDVESDTEHDFARNLKHLFETAQADWYGKSHPLLAGKNLTDFLDGLEEQDLIAFLIGMSEIIDYPLHDLVKPYLQNFSSEARGQWIRLITDVSPEASPMNPEASPMNSEASLMDPDTGIAGLAEQEVDSTERLGEIYRLHQLLPLVGLWSDPAIIECILDWFLEAEEPDERIAESVSLYLRELGEEVCPILIARIHKELDEGRAENHGTETLLQDVAALARYNDEYRQEGYLVLRKAFLLMDDKVIPAICLGDLGTYRAIPFLRSYVEKKQGELSRDLYYEILSSINRLGGSTKDLPDPFGDFSQGTSHTFDFE